MSNKGKLKILDTLTEIDLSKIRFDLAKYSLSKFLAEWPNISRKNYYKLIKYFNLSAPKIEYHWYTNGENDLKLYDDENIPDGYYQGRTNYGPGTTNTIWITNGTDTKLIKNTENIPEGFIHGSSFKSTAGYKTYNNGREQICIKPDSEVPDGFVQGILDSSNYKKAAQKRKVTYYNNGIDQIKVVGTNTNNLDGYVEGKLKKSKEEKLKSQLKNQFKYSDKFIEYRLDKDKTINFLEAFEQKPTYNDLKLLFPEVGIQGIYDWIKEFKLENYINIYSSHSSYEKEILELFPNAEFISDRNKLDGLEIDLYSKKYNIGIEFNGNYWHSSLFKDKYYHLNKSKLAESKNIRLIHIYEYEWENPVVKEKIIQMLNIALNNNINKIYARDCSIKQITNKEAKLLNDKIHLQNHRNAQVTYGLYYNNELVQLMSFSKTKYNKNLKNDNEWEIIRGCPGSNNIVIGGVSKLFKHFVNDYHPNKVFSYCDFNKFDGKSYEKLGMEFIGYTGPDFHWWLNTREVVPRNPNKHKEYKENAIAQIWGAGSKKYEIIFNKDIYKQ